MHSPHLSAFLIAIALYHPGQSAADDQTILDEVVVDSSSEIGFDRYPHANHWQGDELLRSGQRELSQLLLAAPGLVANSGMKGGPTGLSLRGAAGGMGLVQIDGIPIYETMPGLTPVDLFPVENFDSVEVIRGSAAMLNYGRSLGGLINLRGRHAKENGAALHLEGGSFGTVRETASADFGNQQHRFNFTASRDDLFDGTYWADSGAGNSERDDFHSHQLALRIGNQLSDRAHLESSVYYVNSDSGVDSYRLKRVFSAQQTEPGNNPSGERWSSNPTFANALSAQKAPSPRMEFVMADDPARLEQEIWLAQSTAAIDIQSHWRSELQLGHMQQRVSAFINDVLPTLPAYLAGFDNRLSLARWKNSHRFWLDNRQRRGWQFEWGGEGLYEHGQSLSIDSLRGQRGTGSGFAHLQADWDDWQALLAVRADHFDDYASHAVYHAGLSWQMTRNWQWFASGGTGYRAPSFSERLMWPFSNFDLKPEQSAGGEFGFRWNDSSGNQLSANYYHHRYRELIQVERSVNPPGLYLINNMPRAEVKGVEASLQSKPHPQLTSGLDYTWLDAVNSDTGAPLPRRPNHAGRLWSEWRWQDLPLKLWVQGVYRGPRFDGGGTARIGDSFQLDMQLSYQVAAPLSIYLRGENLTDNREPQVIGRDTPGAGVYGGLHWTLR